MPLITVRLDKVVATQRSITHAHVMDMVPKDPSTMPPPIVARHNGQYPVLDGHNRIGAAWERGDTKVKVRLAK